MVIHRITEKKPSARYRFNECILSYQIWLAGAIENKRSYAAGNKEKGPATGCGPAMHQFLDTSGGIDYNTSCM
jgi:hypothetical protein